MFCSNCGKEILQDAKFCSKCGCNLNSQSKALQDDKAHCPECNSTDIIVGKKGYNSQAGVWTMVLVILGFLTFGVTWVLAIILLLTGFIGSNDTQWICKKCGYKWVQEKRKHTRKIVIK